MNNAEKKAVEKLRKACSELDKLGLGLFGWSGTLVVVRNAQESMAEECPHGRIGQEIVADDFPINADGGDPGEWEQGDTLYLVS